MRKAWIVGWMWVISLGLLLACSHSESAEGPAETGNEKGKKIWRTYCVLCHGADGKLGLNGAMDLSVTQLTLEERIEVITHGRNTMVPYKGVIDEDEIRAVAEYTLSFNTSE